MRASVRHRRCRRRRRRRRCYRRRIAYLLIPPYIKLLGQEAVDTAHLSQASSPITQLCPSHGLYTRVTIANSSNTSRSSICSRQISSV